MSEYPYSRPSPSRPPSTITVLPPDDDPDYYYHKPNHLVAGLNTRVRRNLMVLHCYIQWLEHKDILLQWVDEMCNENENAWWTIETRSIRLLHSNHPENIPTYGFSTAESILGYPFWKGINDEWEKVYYHLINEMDKSPAFNSQYYINRMVETPT